MASAVPSTRTYRVKPITGKFRRIVIFDISMALGLGTVAAYGFWYGIHLPGVRQRDEYYLKIEKDKSAARSSAISSFISEGK